MKLFQTCLDDLSIGFPSSKIELRKCYTFANHQRREARWGDWEKEHWEDRGDHYNISPLPSRREDGGGRKGEGSFQLFYSHTHTCQINLSVIFAKNYTRGLSIKKTYYLFCERILFLKRFSLTTYQRVSPFENSRRRKKRKAQPWGGHS